MPGVSKCLTRAALNGTAADMKRLLASVLLAGLPGWAASLTITQQCLTTFIDGTTSTACGFPDGASVFWSFTGGVGSNVVIAQVGADAEAAGLTVIASQASIDMVFEGMTAG